MGMHQINGVRIRTSFVYPPIPVRMFDWSAIDDDTYDGADDSSCPIGHGSTEQAAIEDLLDQIEAEGAVNELVRANGQFGVGA